ncbi:MAG: exodeoxyribonuclease V subunit alpha [Desulfobacula sp.]
MISLAFKLEVLFEHNLISEIDYFFAKSITAAFNEEDPVIIASCAIVSRSLFEGHICLDILEIAGTQRPLSETGDIRLQYPDKETWVTSLIKSSLVSDGIHTPIVFDSNHKLYLAKYFDFQNRLVDNIVRRVSVSSDLIDEILIDEILMELFPDCNDHQLPQKRAAKNALLKKFTIISGGPGTGKTHVIGIIRKLISIYAEKTGQIEQSIISVAPTGKASSKLEEGSTIHAVLRPLFKKPGFHYHKKNPLNKDVVIIDEASMIDLPLLVRLLEAIPLESNIIMTGDKHQLTSIQAGAVFSDICSVDNLSSVIFSLDRNFRSRGRTGIEKLSKAINERDIKGFESILLSFDYPDLIYEEYKNRENIMSILQKHVKEGYKSFKEAKNATEAIAGLDEFRILCAHNKGDFGTLQINHICEKILRTSDNSDIGKGIFMRPIMVNANNYKKGLFNGDTGVVVEKNGEITAFLKSLDNKMISYRCSDLPSHDTAFAITIHKSQGSEFDSVMMVIPDKYSPVVTKQLLYTGVTRARKKVILIGNLDVMKAAIRLNVKRDSGLEEYLKIKLRKQLS